MAGESRPFAGVNVLLLGDFYQLPPPSGGYLADVPSSRRPPRLSAAANAEPDLLADYGRNLVWGGALQGVTELEERERCKDDSLKERGVGRKRDGPFPVRLRQQPRVDHADLVDDEPSPVAHSLCRLLAHGAVQRRRIDAQAAGVVEGPPANVGRVDGLERRHLPQNDLAKRPRQSSEPELARAS